MHNHVVEGPTRAGASRRFLAPRRPRASEGAPGGVPSPKTSHRQPVMLSYSSLVSYSSYWSLSRRPPSRGYFRRVRAQTDRPFAEELPRLLEERGLSQRKLAQLIDL